jgi:cytoskeletal protein RodZ
MRIARPSVIVGVVVTAVLLAGCGRGQQEQSVAEQLANAQGQTAGSGQAGGPDGTGSPTGSPDDMTPSPSSSDDGSSDAPTGDDSSALPTTGHSESESPESHAATPSSSRTRTETPSPTATATHTPRPSTSPTQGGGGGGGNQADKIRVSKCYTNATSSTGGELLIKASSSDPNATLVAYRSDGSRIGEVQNGGGSRYGGTVMPYQSKDPGACVIKSSSGGSISVPTTPFKL